MRDILEKPILVTGVAGFIGFHTACALQKMGAKKIIGIDNINDYYDINLKKERLKILQNYKDVFTFYKKDLADKEAIDSIFDRYKPDHVIHLAAQAGVRYSIDHPYTYVQSNLIGFMNILEAIRNHNVKHTVYASSSSVYGANNKLPYSENDRTDMPVSLYAATKKSNEMLAFSYSSMYKIPLTGLRFFTVYGPYGRPDMAYYKFAKLMTENKPITVYNNGNMMRDFTYVDDIVTGILGTLNLVPEIQNYGRTTAPHNIYNIGHNNPEKLSDLISLLEKHLGIKAQCHFEPMQTGDVLETYADIDLLNQKIGFKPTTSLDEGLKHFVDWFKK